MKNREKGMKIMNGKYHINKKILALAGMGVLIFLMLGIYLGFRPQTIDGSKEIQIEIVYPEQDTETFIIYTEKGYLEEAISECSDIVLEGNRTSQFGLMIEAVNGVRAVYETDHAYWEIQLNGSPCSYGISQQPIQDGECYQLVYTKAGDS